MLSKQDELYSEELNRNIADTEEKIEALRHSVKSHLSILRADDINVPRTEELHQRQRRTERMNNDRANALARLPDAHLRSPLIFSLRRSARAAGAIADECERVLRSVSEFEQATANLYASADTLFDLVERTQSLMANVTFCEISRAYTIPDGLSDALNDLNVMSQRTLDDAIARFRMGSGYNWDAIMEFLSRPPSGIATIEHQALATLMLQMPVSDLETLFNLHLRTQPLIEGVAPNGSRRMFYAQVNVGTFAHINGIMNERLWDVSVSHENAGDFTRLFLVWEMMQTQFGFNSRNHFNSDSSNIISLNQSPDGIISIVAERGVFAQPSHVGRQRIDVSLQNPRVARDIGPQIDGGVNITSNATRIAFAFRFSNNNEFGISRQEGEGTMVNAMRHVVWQAVITTRFGTDVARDFGYAHEADPLLLERVSNPHMHRFNNLNEADTAVDLLNNQIGREIGASGQNLSLLEVTELTLAHARNPGFYTVAKRDDHFVIERTAISETEYSHAMAELARLDANGFPPEDSRYRANATEGRRNPNLN